MIEPYKTTSLHTEFAQVADQRRLQRWLPNDPIARILIRTAIVRAVSLAAQLALKGSIFQWDYSENLGGTLLILYREEPPLIHDQSLLCEILHAVKARTGVQHIVVGSGPRPLVCCWNGQIWKNCLLDPMS